MCVVTKLGISVCIVHVREYAGFDLVSPRNKKSIFVCDISRSVSDQELYVSQLQQLTCTAIPRLLPVDHGCKMNLCGRGRLGKAARMCVMIIVRPAQDFFKERYPSVTEAFGELNASWPHN